MSSDDPEKKDDILPGGDGGGSNAAVPEEAPAADAQDMEAGDVTPVKEGAEIPSPMETAPIESSPLETAANADKVLPKQEVAETQVLPMPEQSAAQSEGPLYIPEGMGMPVPGPAPAPSVLDKAKGLLSTTAGRIGAAVAAVAVLLALLLSTHVICFHEWSEATCIDPQTCAICGRTQGDALGHDWLEATCEEPQTCARCGETVGAKLGHDVASWTVAKEATCTEAGEEQGKCTRCGATQTREIPMVAHEYSEWETVKAASCTEEGQEKRTCKNCSKEETRTVTKVDHKPGDWEVVEEFTVKSSGSVVPGIRARVCTVCGATVDVEEYTIELSMSQKNAMRTAESYLSWAGFSYTRLIEQLEYEGFSHEDATFAADHCGADWFEQAEKCAASYMSWSSFSRDRLIEQLEYEGFTREQAEHGAASVGY